MSGFTILIVFFYSEPIIISVKGRTHVKLYASFLLLKIVLPEYISALYGTLVPG